MSDPNADLDAILDAIPLGYVGPDNGEPVPPDYGPGADEYEWLYAPRRMFLSKPLREDE